MVCQKWMGEMSDELWKMTAVDTVARLRKKEISPLDLVEASAKRIAEVEPAVNAMPTLCLDRARDHAKRIMAVRPAKLLAKRAGSPVFRSRSRT